MQITKWFAFKTQGFISLFTLLFLNILILFNQNIYSQENKLPLKICQFGIADILIFILTDCYKINSVGIFTVEGAQGAEKYLEALNATGSRSYLFSEAHRNLRNGSDRRSSNFPQSPASKQQRQIKCSKMHINFVTGGDHLPRSRHENPRNCSTFCIFML